MWVFASLEWYNSVYTYVRERFDGRSVDVIGIPNFAFTLIESTIPFSDKN
jgi:hypothetical protein